LSVYLDTQIVMWLAASRMKKLTRDALRAIESSDLIISPMVLFELGCLFEINRLVKPPLAMLAQLKTELGLELSDHPFPAVAHAALFETWTRDPFDRLIVAQARSDGFSGLISSDENIQQNYSRTIW
jgi:PIN domain nuclease of toxin-antitoxin system